MLHKQRENKNERDQNCSNLVSKTEPWTVTLREATILKPVTQFLLKTAVVVQEQ